MKSVDAALRFYNIRKKEQKDRSCPTTLKNDASGRLEIMSAKMLKLNKSSLSEKVLVCQDLQTKPLTEAKTCNFDSTMPAAVSCFRFSFSH